MRRTPTLKLKSMTPLKIKRFTLADSLRCLLGFILVVAVASYFVFQARFLLQGPTITLTKEPDIVQTEPMVTIAGATENIVSLTLNGRTIYTDEAGNFEETLILENGYTIMTLRAEDRYGKERVLKQPFVYAPTELITRLNQ